MLKSGTPSNVFAAAVEVREFAGPGACGADRQRSMLMRLPTRVSILA
jgi:hypothetical protein